MKKISSAILLALILISANCIISDIITTSSSASEKVKNNQGKKILPKEHFCSENKIQKLTCQVKSKNACKNVSINENSPICGFDNLGQRFEFKRECEAFENSNIKYYFKGTCDQAPDICTKTEECVNGICVEMLQEPENSNRVVCNAKSDCPSVTDLCVANKCIDKRELMSVMSKTEKNNPKLAEKTAKMRGDVTKRIQDIKKKNVDDLKALNELTKKNK